MQGRDAMALDGPDRGEGEGASAREPGLVAGSAGAGDGPPPDRVPDVYYEPSPRDVVYAMLRLAKVRPGDVVYDLGCGDGRVVITAARRFGARGVGIEIDPRRLTESRDMADLAGVADLLEFRRQDFFTAPIADATVLTLFLSPELNLALRPRLLRDLRPGARIVSHWHDMDDWPPQETRHIWSNSRERPIYLWTVPEH
ncbi:MAG: methyltransferase domain-containing protein [Candidatus Rokuibacteriota bacterium]